MRRVYKKLRIEAMDPQSPGQRKHALMSASKEVGAVDRDEDSDLAWPPSPRH